MYDEIENKFKALTDYGQLMSVPKFAADESEIEKIVSTLKDVLVAWPEAVDIRIGAAWQRKCEMNAGSASRQVSPSPYRNSNECVLLNVMIVAESWQVTDELKALTEVAAKRDEEASLAEQRKLLEQKKAELEAGSEALDKLKAKIAEMESKLDGK